MDSENEDDKKCRLADLVIPEEVRLTYFPTTHPELDYNVLPLFEQKYYTKKLADEVSILNNQSNAEKWEQFRDGLPESYTGLKPTEVDRSKIIIFANYRQQKVPPDYLTAYISPPSSEALFRKTK